MCHSSLHISNLHQDFFNGMPVMNINRVKMDLEVSSSRVQVVKSSSIVLEVIVIVTNCVPNTSIMF